MLKNRTAKKTPQTYCKEWVSNARSTIDCSMWITAARTPQASLQTMTMTQRDVKVSLRLPNKLILRPTKPSANNELKSTCLPVRNSNWTGWSQPCGMSLAKWAGPWNERCSQSKVWRTACSSQCHHSSSLSKRATKSTTWSKSCATSNAKMRLPKTNDWELTYDLSNFLLETYNKFLTILSNLYPI